MLSILLSFLATMYGSGVVSAIDISIFMYIRYIWWPAVQEQTISYFNPCLFQGDVLGQVFQMGIGSSMVDVVAPLFFLKRMAY